MPGAVARAAYGRLVAASRRLTIRSIDADPRAAIIARGAAHLGLSDVGEVGIADIIFFDADLTDEDLQSLHGVLVDPLLQRGSWELPSGRGVEIMRQPGVTDTDTDAVEHAADELGIAITGAATGTRVEFDEQVAVDEANEIVARLVANRVVDRWVDGIIEPIRPTTDVTPATSLVPLDGLSADDLEALNAARGLSLDPEELLVIQAHFVGEGRAPTDAELEMLAQTWSEHCSHKTFRATLTTPEGPDGETTEVVPLLKQLRDCTDNLDAPFVKSAFVGNAGVIEFEPGTTLALKAETHNHPSAIEPFGGANTGVGGVIRDVLGIAHRPIAITDVLCFGPPDLALDELPDGALHPSRIQQGVIDGVADYGNKIGLPTVAGAILYDPAYTTTPLVFAGCIGTAPSRPLHAGPQRGDRVVVLGGATGRDGIRGATFSSATMDATTGEVAGASVQIGDPIVEKLLIDVLVGAEDLFTAITDCGAGGLSSAIGEMAEQLGADVNLDLVPRKYPGLAPWEVWLSEAQERMVVAVPPRSLGAFQQRCIGAGVEIADLGSFTGDGYLTVRSGDDVVVHLPTQFLHDGRPQRHMTAELPLPNRSEPVGREVADVQSMLLALLAHPNIASKSGAIRRYDHEILGSTVVRPLLGAAGDGPGRPHQPAYGSADQPLKGQPDDEAAGQDGRQREQEHLGPLGRKLVVNLRE